LFVDILNEDHNIVNGIPIPLDSLSQSVRVPAVSRLQKVYNVNLALMALIHRGCEFIDNPSRDDLTRVQKQIVDGNYEFTVSSCAHSPCRMILTIRLFSGDGFVENLTLF
jgi:hypothetical protein